MFVRPLIILIAAASLAFAEDSLEEQVKKTDMTSADAVYGLGEWCEKNNKPTKGLKLLIIDYLQLITPSSHRQGDSTVQQVTEISRSLKGLARELNIPVLALSQLSRAVEQRRDKPRLSDLRDSGALEQDADVVILMHREDYYDENSKWKGVAEAIVAKQRMGPTGTVRLFFEKEYSRFKSVPRGWEPPDEDDPEPALDK